MVPAAHRYVGCNLETMGRRCAVAHPTGWVKAKVMLAAAELRAT